MACQRWLVCRGIVRLAELQRQHEAEGHGSKGKGLLGALELLDAERLAYTAKKPTIGPGALPPPPSRAAKPPPLSPGPPQQQRDARGRPRDGGRMSPPTIVESFDAPPGAATDSATAAGTAAGSDAGSDAAILSRAI